MSGHRHKCLFKDLLDDLDDGSLRALSLRSDRNFDALPAISSTVCAVAAGQELVA